MQLPASVVMVQCSVSAISSYMRGYSLSELPLAHPTLYQVEYKTRTQSWVVLPTSYLICGKSSTSHESYSSRDALLICCERRHRKSMVTIKYIEWVLLFLVFFLRQTLVVSKFTFHKAYEFYQYELCGLSVNISTGTT